MSQISLEAQTLIDRLGAMDPANPRNDKAAIERAITKYFGALGLPERPFVWAEDARDGYALAIERAFDASDSGLAADWDSDVEDAVREVPWDAKLDAPWIVARAAAREAVRDDAWLSTFYGACNNARRDGAHHAAQTVVYDVAGAAIRTCARVRPSGAADSCQSRTRERRDRMSERPSLRWFPPDPQGVTAQASVP